MAQETPLAGVHRELGAKLVDFAGWSMPVRYGSETAEHVAVRTAAGLFDLSHMGEVEVSGPEAARALDRALVGRASAIGVGRARYSLVVGEDGGTIDDLVVYRLAEDRFLVVANAANSGAVAAELAVRAEGFDADVHDASGEWALVAVQGPRSVDVLSGVVEVTGSGGADPASLRYYAIAPAVLAGHDVLLARTGYTGEDGFEVYCRPDAAEGVWRALLAVGRPHGLVPAGLSCRDTLRLEAGMPLYGHELTRQTTPFEAGLGRVVAFDKPDGFVGDAALARRRDEGPAVVLVGLVAAGKRSPRAGQAVVDPSSGEEVGAVTSGSPSPTLGRPIAMAYVPGDLADAGTRLEVDVRGSREPVEVVALPFYARER
ncbi:glycine cleavage system aminomethyltransferase GcvT [Streptomyces sp. NP160]|uniref:glycine cleavage system aminomethyltransferase GcvT n=1 Tax=Streptomyces sp. NP160 TaxID=2586637 RepID=UPI00111A3D69|nr:glycine cleavage system aminomethyltransferase GcvT [Streptomyces sp. NP160]TNM69187.1 glycine cleavage system aminomethyltransferase GcvT [Streptomyces sp. NP160]